MKKALIGVLSLVLVIGAGAVGVKAFANEKEAATQAFTNNTNPVISNFNQNSSTQGQSEFRVLNQGTNQFERLDDSDYRNSNPNYGQGCPHMNYGSYRGANQY